MKFIFLTIVVVTLYSITNAQPDWPSDIRFLKKELPSKHINLFRRLSHEEFEKTLSDLEQQAYLYSDMEIRMSLQKLFARIGDAHTTIELGDEVFKAGVLPLHLYWFKEGLYILHTLPHYKEVLGSRIDSINSFPVQQIIDSLSTLFVDDSTGNTQSLLPRYLPIVEILRYFGFCIDDSISLSLMNRDGHHWRSQMIPEVMNSQNRVVLIPDSVNYIIKSENAWFDAQYFEEDSLVYVIYNKCWSRELALEYGKSGTEVKDLPSFADFEIKVMKMIERTPFKKFVFDMRYNRGGNSAQGTAFIKKISLMPEVNTKGKLFVVIGRRTFSSGVLNAMDFKTITNAVLIGETAGGTPDHFGEVQTMSLPSSKLKVSYSTKYFNRTNQTLSVLQPDIEVEFSFDAFMSGKDPVYERIKKY